MSIVYSQNFDAYPDGLSLTDAQLNYTMSYSGAGQLDYKVKTAGPFGTPAALVTNSSGWITVMYEGITNLTYTDASWKTNDVWRPHFIVRGGTATGYMANGGYVFLIVNNSTWGLYKCAGGSIGAALVSGSDTWTSPLTIRMTAIANVITVYKNGTLLFSYTDPSNSYPSGRIGFGGYSNGAPQNNCYDDIVVDDGTSTAIAGGFLLIA